MRLILTHEQADFDALASLLGAWLCDETAIPLLPYRVNRNVRAFVTLYGAELPFVELRDMPNEAVHSLTLVDTQSLTTIKGVSSATCVYVVDHHPQRPDLPPHWVVSCQSVGATTTLFVEELRERAEDGEEDIGVLQATLLLLGIYEDTGSLTYSRTTARDLHAAAYLLEHGADLRLAVDFLNHPLSLVQQELYEQLRTSARHHRIHGHLIVTACGDANNVDEELSTIAHKLRDLFEPDGLFVLVKTHSGVQLIARSTTDHIDVAEVAACFGGGGHERASAALIRGRPLPEVCDELLQVLAEKVRPAVTVAQIMSRRPQVLSPGASVHEAALKMQRYGYEGYPVVSQGKVVGLLTRRAVDRAIAHKLNLTAASLMNAGEVTVFLDDSIEHLQRIMTDTGWGQVPVLNPQTGEIVGIVTRTDLLKMLSGILNRPARGGAHPSLVDRLAAAVPPAHLHLLHQVAAVAHDQHLAIYIVGGFVRDLLLDRPGLDFDIVVEGDAIALAHALSARYGGRVTSHSRFGTAKWHLVGVKMEAAADDSQLSALQMTSLDLISARTEFYTHPTALPTVERGSIKLDLHRRDFTINTLALRLDGRHFGELHDYWGGLNDLRRGLVRVLHSISFVDDPTRMLRAVRFEQRFGFCIESRTQQLLQEALPLIGRVSGERVRHELDHFLDEPKVIDMLARLNEVGVLKVIHPDLIWDAWFRQRLEKLNEFDAGEWGLSEHVRRQALKRILAYGLWVIRLPRDRAQGLLERLMLPKDMAMAFLAAGVLYHELPALANLPPSQIVARFDPLPRLALVAVSLAVDDLQGQELLKAYLTRWSQVQPVTTGSDLRARGVKPGPMYRVILASLRNAWLDGAITSPESEAEFLADLLGRLQATK